MLVPKDGRETAIEDSAAPIQDDDGEICGVIMVSRDATEGRRAEQAQRAVRESEQRPRALVNASSDVAYGMSPDGSEMRPLDGRGPVAGDGAPIRDRMRKNLPSFEHDRVKAAIRRAISGRRRPSSSRPSNPSRPTAGRTSSSPCSPTS